MWLQAALFSETTVVLSHVDTSISCVIQTPFLGSLASHFPRLKSVPMHLFFEHLNTIFSCDTLVYYNARLANGNKQKKKQNKHVCTIK